MSRAQDSNAALAAFIADIEQVCRKHDMQIGHEDTHGAFVIGKGFNEHDAEWFAAAYFEDES